MTAAPASTADRPVAMSPRPADGWWAAFAALVVRLGVVVWAGPRFPPAEDGHFYQVVAGRIGQGLGYTWAWPDGAVTFAAHYPVGYPALIGGFYALFGPYPVVAMTVNAALGAASVLAVHRLASVSGSRAAALVSALAVGLHPGLVFYTPALMTEGVAASLIAIAAWVTVLGRGVPADRGGTRASPSAVTPSTVTPPAGMRSAARAAIGAGVVLGMATLVRPQSLLLAPLFGALAARDRNAGLRGRLGLGGLATACALLCCAPWTVRNCERMNACVLVSANAGWNLFIGAADGATGAWVPIERLGVPEACKTVWGEAEKDACFARAGREIIWRDPLRFLSLVPKKLAATFDYAGAAGWYLHSSNPEAFPERAKLVLGVVETLWERGLVLAGIAAAALARGSRPRLRLAVGGASSVFLLVRSGWVAHLGLCVVAALFGRRLLDRPVLLLGAGTVFVTALTHAAFFGAGRYSLVCFPLLSALAGTVLTLGNGPGDTEDSKES